MLEFFQYLTSSVGVFVGCTLFTCGVITSTGWAINAILIGIRGKQCTDV